MNHVKFENCTFQQVHFTNVRASYVLFIHSELSDCYFLDTDLGRSNFQNCRLENISYVGLNPACHLIPDFKMKLSRWVHPDQLSNIGLFVMYSDAVWSSFPATWSTRAYQYWAYFWEPCSPQLWWISWLDQVSQLWSYLPQLWSVSVWPCGPSMPLGHWWAIQSSMFSLLPCGAPWSQHLINIPSGHGN